MSMSSSSLVGTLGCALTSSYDLKTLTPVPEWSAMYEEAVKEDLRRMGLEAAQ